MNRQLAPSVRFVETPKPRSTNAGNATWKGLEI